MPKKIDREIKAIIFDLDNVLYDERLYIFNAYKEIADYLSKKFRLNEKEIYNRLVNNFQKKTSVYPKLFNNLLEDYFGKYDEDLLKNILSIYSSIKPKIRLYDGTREILLKLKKKYKLGLLTNGRIETQKNKVKLLDIKNFFDAIVYARKFGKEQEKPSTIPYKALLKNLNISSKNTLSIEDNPYTDFKGAKKLGILTTRVLTGEFKNINSDKKYQPDFTIKNLKELFKLLNYEKVE
jgi:putative hydrolase of the HAD superfamily